MSRISILTDSTSDIPGDIARRLGITIVPAYVQMDGQSLRDGEQITRAEFYRRLPALKETPTTAVPPAYDFAAAFRQLSSQVDQVIAILVSTTLSGMLNVARLGSMEVPELEVHLVDSKQVLMGLGLQAIVAAEDAAAGKSVSEILAHIQDIQPRIRILGVLDTLTYLHRSGRVAWAQAVAARLLRIKPLIELYQGEASLIGQVRTRHRAIDKLLEMIAGLGRLERLVLIHTAAPDVDLFHSRLRALFSGPIPVSEVGPVVGTHLGPRALGIAAITAA